MSGPRIAILGSGPAGLIAAWAIERKGYEPIILTKDLKPSPIGGAQYLHQPIPGWHSDLGPDGHVFYVRIGTPEGYAKKVYADGNQDVSWTHMPASGVAVPAWDLSHTYQRMHEYFGPAMIQCTLGPLSPPFLLQEYDFVICAMPQDKLFPGWERRQQETYITRALPDPKQFRITYNGEPRVPWSRHSNIFGHAWYESPRPMTSASIRLIKPVSSNIQLNDRRWLFVGRFGKWDKTVLLSDVYDEVSDALH